MVISSNIMVLKAKDRLRMPKAFTYPTRVPSWHSDQYIQQSTREILTCPKVNSWPTRGKPAPPRVFSHPSPSANLPKDSENSTASYCLHYHHPGPSHHHPSLCQNKSPKWSPCFCPLTLFRVKSESYCIYTAHHLSVLISQYSPLCSLSPRCSRDPSDQPGSPPLLGLCTRSSLTTVLPSSDSSLPLVFAHCHPLSEAVPSPIQNVSHPTPPKKKYQLSTLYLLSLLYLFSLVLVLTDSRFTYLAWLPTVSLTRI